MASNGVRLVDLRSPFVTFGCGFFAAAVWRRIAIEEIDERE
jgi:hypothetical protein